MKSSNDFGSFPITQNIHFVAKKRHIIPPFVSLQATPTEIYVFGNFEGLLHGAFI